MVKDNGAEAQRARAEKAFAKQHARDEQAVQRVTEEVARVAALDAKTARLKALRLARDAEAADAEPAARPGKQRSKPA